jgi:hypothetical protein
MITKILDKYIKYPLIWDSLITTILLGILFLYQKYISVIPIEKSVLNSLVNELISSSIGIAGFLITALTIILTFKDNLKSRDKSPDLTSESKDIQSGIELLFHSKHYKRIVTVFFVASIVLVFSFFYFSIIELLWKKLSETQLVYLILGAIVFIVLAVLRCLLILYKIIQLQIKK